MYLLYHVLLLWLCTTGCVAWAPVVLAHGMGDYCKSQGMVKIGNIIRVSLLNVSTVTCIPTGNDAGEDINNGFFMTMDENVEVFARKVKGNPLLRHGFNAMGFSQGNLVIRGYMQKHNDPPVLSWVSIHGPLTGVSSLPGCDPNMKDQPWQCGWLNNLIVSPLVYTPVIQDHLFQANYYRDAKKVNDSGYRNWSPIGRWNQEVRWHYNMSYRTNFLKTSRMVLVKAKEDILVTPPESSWWGAYGGPEGNTLLKMEDTPWYKFDSFGLRTAHEQNRLFRTWTSGGHLNFSIADIHNWIQYFRD